MNALGTLVAVIVLGCLGYVVLPLYQAIQRAKILMFHATPYEKHEGDSGLSNTGLSILVAGDSTAVGTGSATPAESIAGRIGADFPQADITNIGVNGLKLEGQELKLQMLPEAAHFTLMVLLIGDNDVTGMTSRKDIINHIKNILDLARERANHVVVVGSGDVGGAPLFKYPLSLLFHKRTEMIRQIFMDEIAGLGEGTADVTYVDIFTAVPPEVFNVDIPHFYAIDHFHPSGYGYEKWYEQIRPVLQKVLQAS